MQKFDDEQSRLILTKMMSAHDPIVEAIVGELCVLHYDLPKMEYDLGRGISRYLSEDLRYTCNTKLATRYRDDAFDEWMWAAQSFARAIHKEMSDEDVAHFSRKRALKITYDLLVKHRAGPMVQRWMTMFDKYTRQAEKFREDALSNPTIVASRFLRHLSRVYDLAIGSYPGGFSVAEPDENHSWAVDYMDYFRDNIHSIPSDRQRFLMQKVFDGTVSVYVCALSFELPAGARERVTKGVVGDWPIQLVSDFVSLHCPTPGMTAVKNGRVHFYFCLPRSAGEVVGNGSMKFENVYCPEIGVELDDRDVSLHGGRLLVNGESLNLEDRIWMLEWNLKRHPDQIVSYIKLVRAYKEAGLTNLASAVAENACYNTYVGDESKFDKLHEALPEMIPDPAFLRRIVSVWTDRSRAPRLLLDNGGFNPLNPSDEEWAEVGGFVIPRASGLKFVRLDDATGELFDV